jgi:hypothetical protein
VNLIVGKNVEIAVGPANVTTSVANAPTGTPRRT